MQMAKQVIKINYLYLFFKEYDDFNRWEIAQIAANED